VRVTIGPAGAQPSVPSKSPTDAELLRRAVDAADGDAFAELYRRHVDAVLAYLRRRVPTPELALDLTAETFAVAIADAHRFRGDGPVAAWLYGIARIKLLEALRRGRVEDEARRRLHHEPLVLTDDDLEEVEARADRGNSALAAGLADLPEPTRAALLARIVDEEPYEDIAARLACSEQVVRQRVHRGLRRLRAALEEAR
jgi:RNA polymerase sigma factor (sigma-70 family)